MYLRYDWYMFKMKFEKNKRIATESLKRTLIAIMLIF